MRAGSDLCIDGLEVQALYSIPTLARVAENHFPGPAVAPHRVAIGRGDQAPEARGALDTILELFRATNA